MIAPSASSRTLLKVTSSIQVSTSCADGPSSAPEAQVGFSHHHNSPRYFGGQSPIPKEKIQLDGGVVNRNSASQHSDMEVGQDQSECVNGAEGGPTLDGNADDRDSSDTSSIEGDPSSECKDEYDPEELTEELVLQILLQMITHTKLQPDPTIFGTGSTSIRLM